jgi:hypothetical protein
MTSNEGWVDTADMDQTRTFHWVLSTNVTVAHPLAVVWSVFRDPRKWYTEYTWEVVSGPPYEASGGLLEGQTLKCRSTHPLPRIPTASEATVSEDYFVKFLKVIPSSEIVSVLSGSVYDFQRYTAFYVWKLVDNESATTVTVDTYGEAHLAAPLTTDQLDEYTDEFNVNWHRSWSTAFLNFGRTLDAESAA